MAQWIRALNYSSNVWSGSKHIGSSLDVKSAKIQNAISKNEKIKSKYLSLLEASLKGGDEKAVKRHTVTNKKLLVHQRLQKLFDNYESTLNLSTIAGVAMEYGNLPSAGVVTAIGEISGQNCMVMANDATVKGGTVFPITLRKKLRAQQIACELALPCVYLVDSGGAFLPLQSQMFPDRNDGGRVFRNQAVMSSCGIPQISVVCGSCTAGAAYIPGMSDVSIIVDKIGTIFLGGPPLIKSATGEEVTEEELGGATLHCRESGVTDYFAATEEEALNMCREVVKHLQLSHSFSCNNLSERVQEPLYPTEELAILSGFDEITRQDGYEIIARLLDGSEFNEFKEKYGNSITTGFGSIRGIQIGLLLNCGSLKSNDALKAAHFVQICDQRNLPLLFLQNSANNKDLDNKSLKDKGKLISITSSTKIPKISVNIGGCIGEDNFTLCGFGMKPTFIFGWPNSLATTDFELNESNPEKGKLPFSTSSAMFDASRMLNDGIILPEHTRKILSKCFAFSAKVKREKLSYGIIRT